MRYLVLLLPLSTISHRTSGSLQPGSPLLSTEAVQASASHTSEGDVTASDSSSLTVLQASSNDSPIFRLLAGQCLAESKEYEQVGSEEW